MSRYYQMLVDGYNYYRLGNEHGFAAHVQPVSYSHYYALSEVGIAYDPNGGLASRTMIDSDLGLRVELDRVQQILTPEIRKGEEGLADIYRGGRFIHANDPQFSILPDSRYGRNELDHFKNIKIAPASVFFNRPLRFYVNRNTGEISEWFVITFDKQIDQLSLVDHSYSPTERWLLLSQYGVGMFTTMEVSATGPRLTIENITVYSDRPGVTKMLMEVKGNVSTRWVASDNTWGFWGYSDFKPLLGYRFKLRYRIENTASYKTFTLPLLFTMFPGTIQENGGQVYYKRPVSMRVKPIYGSMMTYSIQNGHRSSPFYISVDDPDIQEFKYDFPRRLPEGIQILDMWVSQIRNISQGGTTAVSKDVGKNYIEYEFRPDGSGVIRLRNIPAPQQSWGGRNMRATVTVSYYDHKQGTNTENNVDVDFEYLP